MKVITVLIMTFALLIYSCASFAWDGFSHHQLLPSQLGVDKNNEEQSLNSNLADITILYFWKPSDTKQRQWLNSFDKLARNAKDNNIDLNVIAVSFLDTHIGLLSLTHKRAKEVSMLFHSSNMKFVFADNSIKKSYNNIPQPTIIIADKQGRHVESFENLKQFTRYLTKS